ncbi:8574_t:CDS:2, partial [Funneliformis geosporum]
VISDVLKYALGVLESGDEPPYYKRMRVFGYPPGYWGDKVGDDDDDSDDSENEKDSSSEVVENYTNSDKNDMIYQETQKTREEKNKKFPLNGGNLWYNYQEQPHIINNNIEQPPPPGTTSNIETQLQQPPSSWIINSDPPPPPGIIPFARTFNDSQQSPVAILPCQDDVLFSIPSLSEQIQQKSEIMKKSNPYNNIEISNVEDDNDMDLSD